MKDRKLPPMAQAVRAFMVEMDFPPALEKGHASNAAYAGVIQALLNSANYLRLDATEVTVAPSIRQIAAICHSAERSVQRILEKLQAHGIIERQNRGAHLSTVYVVHKYTKILEDAKTGKPYFSHSRHDKVVIPRHDNVVTPETSAEVTTQLPEVTTRPSGVTTTPLRGDKGVVLWDKASGRESSGAKPLSAASENVSVVLSNDPPSSESGTNATSDVESDAITKNGSPTSTVPATPGLSPRQLYEKVEFLQSNRANLIEFYARLGDADKLVVWDRFPQHHQLLLEGLKEYAQ